MRRWLRQRPGWIRFQELNREGWRRAWQRRRIQRLILNTPPVRTAPVDSSVRRVEVRVLTWRRDWVDLLWALKSFYHFARVDYPLYIHDGGLQNPQIDQLRHHFPSATMVAAPQADALLEAALRQRCWPRCLAYRRRNVSTRKLFDFFLLSTAEYVLSIDSDILFFRRPEELLPSTGNPPNRYNRDAAYWYSLSLDELQAACGIRPVPFINSGLSLVRRQSIDFARIEDWLAHPGLFANTWVTEQTLHALCATIDGVELLPETYQVGITAGLADDAVCKHYPSPPRPLLYSEGMPRLLRQGFLQALHGRSALET
jgi:hypothetical protein